MTGQELRELLERVETHDGPVAVSSNEWQLNVKIPDALWPVAIHYSDGAIHTQIADSIAGVLKRDLAERGAGWNVDCLPDPATFTVCAWLNKNQYVVSGDSELEAVLHAWLAAAKAEGWGKEVA